MNTIIKKLIELIEELVSTDAENFFYEVKLGQKQIGKDFTNIVKKARISNDRRGQIKNNIEETLLKILKENNIKTTTNAGTIAESFSFLIDVFIINHLKVWFSEEEIRELNKLENPDPTRMQWLVNASRQANDNRIKLRDLLSKKLYGIILGTEDIGIKEPKLFEAQKRT